MFESKAEQSSSKGPGMSSFDHRFTTPRAIWDTNVGRFFWFSSKCFSLILKAPKPEAWQEPKKSL